MAYVFVFGTLKEGFPNFPSNRGARVPGSFRTCVRLPLYLVGERHSPWLLDTPGSGFAVRGQVFELSADALAALDRLERIDQPDGYRRVAIAVTGDEADARPRTVFAYLKDAAMLTRDLQRIGPLAEYTLAHAALYRKRTC
jgi:gamma-glutamylaminecyclotransferase